MDGHRVLKLNTGNPAVFGFEAPDVIMRDMIAALSTSQGYSTSKGIIPARRAIVTRYEVIPNFPDFDVDDVFLGNGVSELISMVTQALLNDGDEVLGLGDGRDEGEDGLAFGVGRCSPSYGNSPSGDSSSGGGYDQPPRRRARFEGGSGSSRCRAPVKREEGSG